MIVVLGRWPRSFTTLTTRALDAAGCPALRTAGCEVWQHAKAMADPVSLLGPLLDGPGCIKLFPDNMVHLQVAELHPTAVIAPLRPYAESSASWALKDGTLAPEDRLLATWSCLRENAERAGVPWLEFDGHDLIDHPWATAERIAAFLAPFVGPLNVDAMAAVPDPAMRHYGAAAGIRVRITP